MKFKNLLERRRQESQLATVNDAGGQSSLSQSDLYPSYDENETDQNETDQTQEPTSTISPEDLYPDPDSSPLLPNTADALRRQIDAMRENLPGQLRNIGQGVVDAFVSPEDQDKFKAELKKGLEFIQKQRGLAKEYENDPTGFAKDQLSKVLKSKMEGEISKARGMEDIGKFLRTTGKAKARLNNVIRQVDSKQKDLYTGAPQQTTYEGPPQFSRSRSMKQMGFSQGKKK